MRKFLSVSAALVLGLVLSASVADAQSCDPGYVQANIQGTWKVNNAGGQGFGGIFVGKPQVSIEVVGRGGVSINGSQPYYFGRSYGPEANPNGGFWCSFTLDGTPGRIAYASNRWWIVEFGNYNDRNKIELIRR